MPSFSIWHSSCVHTIFSSLLFYYYNTCFSWFYNMMVVCLLSPFGITVVYTPGTSIGFSPFSVSVFCLITQQLVILGEQGIVGLQ